MNIDPTRSAIPNPIKIVPEILLINEILCNVSRVLSFPAINTLNMSAVIFITKHIAKIIILSLNEYSLAKAVAVPNQKRKTFGLSVFSRNPETNIFTNRARVNLISPPSGF
jgi:hypothetical protein